MSERKSYSRSPLAIERDRNQREESRLRNTTQSLQNELGSLQSQFSQTVSDLRNAQGNYERQRELNQSLQIQITNMEALQRRSLQKQEQLMRETNRAFGQIRSHIAATDANLTDLDRRHESHVANVQREFEATRNQIETGLSQAKTERAALQQNIDRIDREREQERQAVIQEKTDKLERARAVVRVVRSGIAPLGDRLETTCLRGHFDSVVRQLELADRLIEEDNAHAAEVAALNANATFLTVEKEHYQRVSELVAAKKATNVEIARLEQQLSKVMLLPSEWDASGEKERRRLEDYYPKACRQIKLDLADAKHRLASAFSEYDEYKDDMRLFEERLKPDVELMRDLMIGVRAAHVCHKKRIERIAKIVSSLNAKFGAQTQEMKHEYGDKDDPKSDLIVEACYSGGRFRIHLPFAEGFHVEAYSMATNELSDQLGNELLEAEKEDGEVRIDPQKLAELNSELLTDIADVDIRPSSSNTTGIEMNTESSFNDPGHSTHTPNRES